MATLASPSAFRMAFWRSDAAVTGTSPERVRLLVKVSERLVERRYVIYRTMRPPSFLPHLIQTRSLKVCTLRNRPSPLRCSEDNVDYLITCSCGHTIEQ